MGSVKILNLDRIAPVTGPYPSPGATIPLSFFDALWVTLPPVQLLFLYPDSPLNSSVLSSLKSSLAQALLNFHSLNGRLTYLSSSGDVIIDCSGAVDHGIQLIEAEYDGVDAGRLASDPVHDVDVLVKLVPDMDVKVLPAAVLAVQVTGFVGGGVAIGVAFHHAVVDGKGMWRFLDEWSRSCRGSVPLGATSDRAVLVGSQDANEVRRRFIRELGPALPNTMATPIPVHSRPQLQRRTFPVSAMSIRSIKQRIIDQTEEANIAISQPTRFVALASHIWVSIAHARANTTDDMSVFAVMVDCRPHLHPPINSSYTGNCLRPLYARLEWSKLQTEDGLARACAEIQRAIREAMEEPLKGYEEWATGFCTLPPMKNRWYVAMSPRFKAYETDFGFGRPKRVEVASMINDGEVQLLCGREEGEIQASVSLNPLCMKEFVKVFERGSSCDTEPRNFTSSLLLPVSSAFPSKRNNSGNIS